MKPSTLYLSIANFCEDAYGIQFDRTEPFFCCVECCEPIYACDFADDTFNCSPEQPHGYCPICGCSFDNPDEYKED